jgi:hypothetical protein
VKQTARLHDRTDFHLQPIQADDDRPVSDVPAGRPESAPGTGRVGSGAQCMSDEQRVTD